LHQIVNFGAFADPRFAEAGAVDGGVGADFHVVADFDDPDFSGVSPRTDTFSGVSPRTDTCFPTH
jgi:hypothetical protein